MNRKGAHTVLLHSGEDPEAIELWTKFITAAARYDLMVAEELDAIFGEEVGWAFSINRMVAVGLPEEQWPIQLDAFIGFREEEEDADRLTRYLIAMRLVVEAAAKEVGIDQFVIRDWVRRLTIVLAEPGEEWSGMLFDNEQLRVSVEKLRTEWLPQPPDFPMDT